MGKPEAQAWPILKKILKIFDLVYYFLSPYFKKDRSSLSFGTKTMYT